MAEPNEPQRDPPKPSFIDEADEAGVASLSGDESKMERINKRIADQHKTNLADSEGANVVHLRSDADNGGLTNIIIHPSTKEKGKWQLSWLDGKMTPFGDTSFKTKEAAIASASGLSSEGPAIGHGGYHVVGTNGIPKAKEEPARAGPNATGPTPATAGQRATDAPTPASAPPNPGPVPAKPGKPFFENSADLLAMLPKKTEEAGTPNPMPKQPPAEPMDSDTPAPAGPNTPGPTPAMAGQASAVDAISPANAAPALSPEQTGSSTPAPAGLPTPTPKPKPTLADYDASSARRLARIMADKAAEQANAAVATPELPNPLPAADLANELTPEQVAERRERRKQGGEQPARTRRRGKERPAPLTPAQIARKRFDREQAIDAEMRKINPRYAARKEREEERAREGPRQPKGQAEYEPGHWALRFLSGLLGAPGLMPKRVRKKQPDAPATPSAKALTSAPTRNVAPEAEESPTPTPTAAAPAPSPAPALTDTERQNQDAGGWTTRNVAPEAGEASTPVAAAPAGSPTPMFAGVKNSLANFDKDEAGTLHVPSWDTIKEQLPARVKSLGQTAMALPRKIGAYAKAQWAAMPKTPKQVKDQAIAGFKALKKEHGLAGAAAIFAISQGITYGSFGAAMSVGIPAWIPTPLSLPLATKLVSKGRKLLGGKKPLEPAKVRTGEEPTASAPEVQAAADAQPATTGEQPAGQPEVSPVTPPTAMEAQEQPTLDQPAARPQAETPAPASPMARPAEQPEFSNPLSRGEEAERVAAASRRAPADKPGAVGSAKFDRAAPFRLPDSAPPKGGDIAPAFQTPSPGQEGQPSFASPAAPQRTAPGLTPQASASPARQDAPLRGGPLTGAHEPMAPGAAGGADMGEFGDLLGDLADAVKALATAAKELKKGDAKEPGPQPGGGFTESIGPRAKEGGLPPTESRSARTQRGAMQAVGGFLRGVFRG